MSRRIVNRTLVRKKRTQYTTAIGWGLILLGTLLGAYIGLYVMFIGGIVQIIEQFGAPVLGASIIAWGVVKILFAALIGWIVALIFILPGWSIVDG